MQVSNSLLSRRSYADEKRENFLHLACRKHAPLDVLKKLCDIQPMLLVEKNKQGQTALHIAVLVGSAPSIVAYLLNQNPTATFVQDNESRTPLHIACLNTVDDPMIRWAYAPVMETVHLLCEANPRMANEEDVDGMTPVDLALVSGASEDVVSYLRHKSANELEKRRIGRQLQKLHKQQVAIGIVANESSQGSRKDIALESSLSELASTIRVAASQSQSQSTRTRRVSSVSRAA